jgi:hypothetical protein
MTPASVREAVVKVRSEPQGAIGVPGSGGQQQQRLRQAVRAWPNHRSVTTALDDGSTISRFFCGISFRRTRNESNPVFNEHDTCENDTSTNMKLSVMDMGNGTEKSTGSEVLENKITRAARPADWRCYAAGRARRRRGAAPRSPP